MAGSGREPSRWARAWKKLTASQADLVHDEMALDAQKAGAEAVSECRLRSKVVLQGTISTISVNPHGGRQWLEVNLDDGTGVATLIWMGRRSIPGIEPGRLLRAEGRLADEGGRKVIFNPQYQLLS